MNRLAVAVLAVSTAIMFAVILGVMVWTVALLTSRSVGGSLFVGVGTLLLVIASAWLGVRIAQPLAKRNREYIEHSRRKRKG